MEQRHRLQKEHLEEETQEQTHKGQTEQDSVMEFDSPEELLRFDSSQNKVPAGVRDRIETSIESDPPLLSRSWWRQLFRRK